MSVSLKMDGGLSNVPPQLVVCPRNAGRDGKKREPGHTGLPFKIHEKGAVYPRDGQRNVYSWLLCTSLAMER